jgi:very-short-patch-repair endonuclease
VFDDVAVRLAERRHGIVSLHELQLHGLSRSDLALMRRSRNWEQPTRTVFRRTGSASSTAQDLVIAVLDAGPDAALGFIPGASWWGMSGCSLRPIHAVGTSSSRRRRAGDVRFHRVRSLPAAWVTELRGVPIVRPELLSLQLFAVCRYERAERLTEWMWSHRLLSGPSLRRFIAQMGRMGRNGTAGVRRYLEERPEDYVPPATGLESRVMQILRDAGIEVRRQVDVGSDDAWTGCVDFLVADHPVVIEVQSHLHHDALCDRRADAARRSRLEEAGFVWVEIWDDAVWARPWSVVADVRAGIARAG